MPMTAATSAPPGIRVPKLAAPGTVRLPFRLPELTCLTCAKTGTCVILYCLLTYYCYILYALVSIADHVMRRASEDRPHRTYVM